MKIYIILIFYFITIFPSLGNEIDNKGLICNYNLDKKNKNPEYYWFSEGQVYKVWFDNKKSVIKTSTYPAYYKITNDYIRFYRIFVLLDTLEFTDKNNTILGVCEFSDSYKKIEELIKGNLN
jgi:hypothetical protein